MRSGTLRLQVEKLHCDMFRFFAEDTDAILVCQGSCMPVCHWADAAESVSDTNG